MKDSRQQQTISSGLRGNRGRYSLDSPPPAAHISYKPEMVGKQYGWVKIISSEKRVEREMESLLCAYRMLLMPFDSMDDPVQSDTGNLAGMSELLGEAKANPYVAGSTADGSQSSLRKPKRQELSIIWRTGNQVLLSIGHQGGNLDFGECARCMPGERNGSNRQQWALRTGEYQICSKEESGQSRIDGAVGMGSAVLAVSCFFIHG